MNFLVSLYWWAWQIKGLSVQIFNHTEFFFNDGDDDDNDDVFVILILCMFVTISFSLFNRVYMILLCTSGLVHAGTITCSVFSFRDLHQNEIVWIEEGAFAPLQHLASL